MDLVSFDGVAFSTAGVTVQPDMAMADRALQGVYITGGNVQPKMAGVSFATFMIPTFVNVGAATNPQSALRALDAILRWDLTTERLLVGHLDDDTQIEILCRPSVLQRGGTGYRYQLVFEASDYWKASTPVAATIVGPTLAGGTITQAVTVAGTVRTRPVVTLFPQKPKTSGATFSQPLTVTETSGHDLVSVPYTYTFDHAALVTAGKSTAAGTDLLVSVNGIPVDRNVTGANTSSCRVTFPLTVDANQTATVVLSYAPSNQTYSGLNYAQDAVLFTVTEQHGVTLANYPYRLDFDHASKVTAGRSKSSGADIRVFVDGVEQDRALNGVNTSTCKVWGKLNLSANGTSVVAITVAASGYDYAGATYNPGNAAVDTGTSTNATIVMTTPVISNNDDSPFALKPVFMNLNATSNPTNYDVRNVSGTDPSVKASIMDIASPAQNGNYIRLYAGGLRLASLTARYAWGNGATSGSGLHSSAFIGESSNLSAWSILRTFARVPSGSGGTGPDTTSFSSGSIAGVVGLERTVGDGSQTTGTANTNFMQLIGSGSTEVSLALVAGDVPTNASLSAPTATAGVETFGYTFNGSLTDELGHTVAIRNLSASSQWTPTVNLLDYSEQMDNASYTKVNTTVSADNASAPDSTQSADTLFETTTNGQHRLTRQISKAASSLPYVFSVYAKAHGRDYIDFNVMDASRANGVNVGFNVTTGSLNFSAIAFGSGFTAGAATITLDANGFYRCSLEVTSNTATTLLGEVLLRFDAGTNSYAGDVTKGVDLWGMQLEQSATVSPYQPVYPVGGVVIDAADRTAYLVDRAGAMIANSALAARQALSITGNDTDWLACEPQTSTTVSWSEPGIDADGLRLDVEAASRWH